MKRKVMAFVIVLFPFMISSSVFAEGYLVTSDLWIKAVINTVEKGPIDAIWQKGGEDTTSRGDRVIWGHFYANPSDVNWGSQNNPDLFVKIWFDVSGRVDVNYFHVSVPDIEVYSDYPYDGTPDEQGTTTMKRRYIRQYYENDESHMDENYEDGAPPAEYLPAGNPSGYLTINDLRIGSIINTVEKGPIDAVWRLGGQDTTARGDQVVWGHFYASPSDVTWGSQDNPDLYVKIWFDVSGRVDVNFFHVSVPDIEGYSDLPSEGAYDQQGTTIMNNRYIRHEYWSDGGETTPPEFAGFDFALNQGDFWEYCWISESSSFSQSGDTSYDVETGRFVVTVGTPVEINGTQAFPIIVTGNTSDAIVDFSPEWSHIAVANGSLCGSTDGVTLETICEGGSDEQIGGGFFIAFPPDETLSRTTSTFTGTYNELSAIKVGMQQSEGGCTYYPSIGDTICTDESMHLTEHEYYIHSIGPLGYIFSSSQSFSGGGFYSAHYHDRTVELIDTSLNLPDGITLNVPPWREVANLNTPRYQHACAVLDDKIYTIGGFDYSDSNALSSVEVYDSETDTWSFGTPMPIAIGYPMAEVASGKIYVLGNDNVLVYDPVADNWTTGAAVPYSDPSRDSTVLPSGEIIVIESSFNVYIYRHNSDQWFYGYSLSYTDTRWFSVASIGFDVYVVGGYRQYMLGDKIWGGAHCYDALTGEWEEDVGWLSESRYSTRSVNLNDNIVTIGGTSTSGAGCRDIEEYDPDTGKWQSLPKMFGPRVNFDAVVLGGEIYVVDGSGEGSVEVYTP